MANKKWEPIQAERYRATLVDACGAPLTGACNAIVGEFVQLGLTPDEDAGTDIEVKFASGRTCVFRPAFPQTRAIEAEITLCGVDPEALAVLTGAGIILDTAGDSIGNRLERQTVAHRISLEMWQENVVEGCETEPCAPGPCEQWTYWLASWIINARITAIEGFEESAAVNITVTGDIVQAGDWGVGPYNVVCTDATPPVPPATCVTPGPLTEPAAGFLQWQLSCIGPPEETCGCIAV